MARLAVYAFLSLSANLHAYASRVITPLRVDVYLCSIGFIVDPCRTQRTVPANTATLIIILLGIYVKYLKFFVDMPIRWMEVQLWQK